MKTVPRNKPGLKTAGIILLIAAVVPVLWLAFAISGVPALQILVRTQITWFLLPLPFFGLAIGFGGNVPMSNIIAVLFILGILLAAAGGILVLLRKNWKMAVAGSVGALICVPVLGLTAIILLVISRSSLANSN